MTAATYYRTVLQQIEGLAYNSVDNQLLVSQYQNDVAEPIISAMDADTGSVVGSGGPGVFVNLLSPISYDPVNNALWAYRSGTIYKFNATTGAFLFSAAVASCNGIFADPYNGTVWAKRGTSISKINPATGAILSTTAVGVAVLHITFDNVGNIWFTCNTAPRTRLFKFIEATLAVSTAYTHSADISFIDYDATRHQVWVYSALTIIGFNLTSLTVVATYAIVNSAASLKYDSYRDVLWYGRSAAGISEKAVGHSASDGAVFDSITSTDDFDNNVRAAIAPTKIFFSGINPLTTDKEVAVVSFAVAATIPQMVEVQARTCGSLTPSGQANTLFEYIHGRSR